MNKRLSIAIDGPASSGKGTVARLVAKALNYAYIDTGAMFRCVALAAQKEGHSWADPQALSALVETLSFDFSWDGQQLKVLLNGNDVTQSIRAETVGEGASDVATHRPVREALLVRQRALAANGGVVMDGRDVGTVVLPNAELKIFLDASIDERAKRRFQELTRKGDTTTFEAVRSSVVERDTQDRTRAEAPLVQAADAVYLDTTGLTPDRAAEIIVDFARTRG